MTRHVELPTGRPIVHHVLTFCAVCDRWIAHEIGHGCQLSPEYRQIRAADRALKVTQLRAAGYVVLLDREDSL